MNESQLQLPSLSKYKPRRNLPKRSSLKRKELLFGRAFVSAFLADNPRYIGSVVQEVSLNGYGIADLVCLKRRRFGKDVGDNVGKAPVIMAFELKMSDWRKALSQAFRYRYFAHVSIVVLPAGEVHRASRFLGTFRMFKVGLWAFDKGTGQIRKLWTPRSSKPLSSQAQRRATVMITKQLDLREPPELSDPLS